MWSALYTTSLATALRQLQRRHHSHQQQRPLQPLQHLPNRFLHNQLKHHSIHNLQPHSLQCQNPPQLPWLNLWSHLHLLK
jgi:hypothetical protein